jgi:hypothetical protein
MLFEDRRDGWYVGWVDARDSSTDAKVGGCAGCQMNRNAGVGGLPRSGFEWEIAVRVLRVLNKAVDSAAVYSVLMVVIV